MLVETLEGTAGIVMFRGGKGFGGLQALEVDPGDFKYVTLSAYPAAYGVCHDVLTCRIAGNPEPVCFPVTCTGARPLAHLRLTGVPRTSLIQEIFYTGARV